MTILWFNTWKHKPLCQTMCQGKNSNCRRSVKIGVLKNFAKFTGKIKKSVWGNVFWYVKVCIFWKCIQYTIKKFHSDKINGTKNALFIFNLRSLFELKQKVHLSKNVSGIFHFRSRFVFIKVYIFVQQNGWTFWL